MPFELLLKGENVTLSEHLAYGLLMQTHPASFAHTMEAAALQDHHWRLMAHNMTLTCVRVKRNPRRVFPTQRVWCCTGAPPVASGAPAQHPA